MRNPLKTKPASPGPSRSASAERAPSVRLAVYDGLSSIPRVVELSTDDSREFIELMANKTYELSQAKGGRIPFSVIREVAENLIHAYFEECVVTILDGGNTIRISDQGPGISDKNAAMMPGFSTASAEMKSVIRGVGSGLPVAKEMIEVAGGKITIEDNLDHGAVITLSLGDAPLPPEPEPEPAPVPAPEEELSDRQKRILFLITELGAAGPSKIQAELGISLSSAYRDLISLEKLGLIGGAQNGKRALTDRGVNYLESMEL